MNIVTNLIDFLLHIDTHLANLIATYGDLIYIIIGGIIFIETGLVFFPFLPGDSLLFAGGALSASDSGLNLIILITVCFSAAFLGNTVNYFIGKLFGEKILKTEFFKKIISEQQLEKSHNFFEKHGAASLVIARFIPIVRTIVPFVAGVSEMSWRKYMMYNFIGALAWVLLGVLAGYFFGNLPFVKENFSFVVIGIVIISIAPMIYHFIKDKKKMKKEGSNVN